MPTRKEINWVIGFSIFVIIITTLPYLMAYFIQGDSWRFSGFIFGVEDGNSYIAKMLSGANGEILFKTPYTTVDQSGFLAFLPYLLLGKLTSAPGQHEQLVALFQIFRWSGILFLSMVSYYFTSLFISGTFFRKTALIISILGGGLGWISLLWNQMPLEIYSPETFGFLSVFGIPHLLFSKAFLLLGIYGFLAWEHNVRNACMIGLAWFMIGFFQPLTIVIGWFVLAAYLIAWLVQAVIKKEKNVLEGFKREAYILVIIGLISSPWVFYNYFSFQTDPFLKGWYSQNIILSPNPIDYILSIGILVPLALWGVYKLSKQANRMFLLSAGWLLIFPLLVYFPILVQRRLAEGFWPLFVILILIPFMEKPFLKRFVGAAAVLLFISTLVLLSGGFLTSLSPKEPVFIARTEDDAFKSIQAVSRSWNIVLAPYQASNAIAAWAPVRVLAGHGPESVNLKQVQSDIDHFNLETDDNARIHFIKQYKVNFILVNSADHSLDNNVFSQKIFGNQDYTVYKITGK